MKYFPVEGLALYCILEPTVLATAGPSREAFSWAALGCAVLFCALYLHLVWRVTRTSHVLISCTALVLYVAALGGPFASLDVLRPRLRRGGGRRSDRADGAGALAAASETDPPRPGGRHPRPPAGAAP